jgi:hypothetical protein
MRIFWLELKRILKTRRIFVMLSASVILSVLMACMAVQGVEYNDPTARQLIGGRAAVDALNKEDNDAYVGPVTVEKLRQALKTCRDVYQKYGQNVPADVYRRKIVPIQRLLDAMLAVYFPNGNNGGYQNLSTLNPNRLKNFYTQRFEVIKGTLESQYPGNQSVLRQAEQLNEKSAIPFSFAKGDPGGTTMSLTFLAFVLVAIGAMITAPNFAAEYQSGADDILRSTKHGRGRFAVAKLCAPLVLLAAMFAVCALIFILLVNPTVGWNSFQVSVQLSLPTNCLAPLNFLQAQFATLLAALLSLLATACLSLFFSTKCRSSTTALILSITIFMLPIMLEVIVESGGNIGGNGMAVLAYALPGGVVGLQGSFYGHLLGVSRFSFVQIGPWAVWVPDLMLGACIVEIPVFFLLAAHAYCRHQAA